MHTDENANEPSVKKIVWFVLLVCVCVCERVCDYPQEWARVSLSPVLAILAERRESIHGNHANGSLGASLMPAYLNII